MSLAAATLRLARPDDVNEVAALERIAFSDPWSPHAFTTLIGNPAVLFLVARHPDALAHGTLLGYIVARFAADEAEIANLAVTPSTRGQGVGAQLLDAALSEGIGRGAAMTYLEVRESNTAARYLYRSRGFAELGRRRRYYRHPVEDALVLGRATAAAPGRVETAHSA